MGASTVRRLCDHSIDISCDAFRCLKVCTKCDKMKFLAEFNTEKTVKDGRRSTCQECDNIRAQIGARARHLKRTFGLTIDQYSEMLLDQGYRCGICATTDPGKGRKHFSVDHNRNCCAGSKSCGKCIRGLLCERCNMAIGLLSDSRRNVESLLGYLKRHDN